ncbi:MAG: helix-turn-helix domain-containing protein [Deltaproteobacteria bacterium]|nr:helix-turn-helix domain-containing protein [Deltaproteobacteria bacterium]MBI2975124.1 helix-turn-helix domain-containing protein [Deltaproteobacteria bacterium]
MNWMTVQDIAKYLQLSTMMVYKLAQEGKIPAAKIGRVWRFEKEAIDAWLKSNLKAGQLPNIVKQTLEDFLKKLKEAFGNNLCRIVLFGSYARGDARENSDVDVLIVLKAIENHWKHEAKIDDIAYQVTFDSGRPIVLSYILVDEKEFLTGMSPLMLNVRKEGKVAA